MAVPTVVAATTRRRSEVREASSLSGALAAFGVETMLAKFMRKSAHTARKRQKPRLFLAWARVWRSKARPEMAAQLLAIDPHSPNEFRCNVIAANIPEFYEAFEVDEGSTMWIDPAKRVAIW
nr:M13-type metalloendopeptidase [Corynebacterium appendicis]